MVDLVGLVLLSFSFLAGYLLPRRWASRHPVLHRCTEDLKVGSVHTLDGISYAGGFFYLNPVPGHYRVVRVDADDIPSDALFGHCRVKILFCRLGREESTVYDVMTS